MAQSGLLSTVSRRRWQSSHENRSDAMKARGRIAKSEKVHSYRWKSVCASMIVTVALAASFVADFAFFGSTVRQTLETLASEAVAIELITESQNQTSNTTTIEVGNNKSCLPEMSLHQMCLDMINMTSPRSSPSFTKMLGILQNSDFFKINIEDRIFRDVNNNIAAMFQAWGLKPLNKVQSDQNDTVIHTLHIETVVSRSPVCDAITKQDCDSIPRVLIQTEQIYAVGKRLHQKLQACHESPLCMIWDFSDYHVEWYKQKGISDSLMLMPIMTQKRLGAPGSNDIVPLQNRSIDVAFFGLITRRRAPFIKHLNVTGLSLVFSQTLNVNVVKRAYANAKICLIIHSYIADSAGETHRLSELARFGCIPVVETWGDKSYLDHYSRCGDVVFADYGNLANTTIEMLSRINDPSATDELQASMKKRLDWWQKDIQWDSLLAQVFDGYPRRITSPNSEKIRAELALS